MDTLYRKRLGLIAAAMLCVLCTGVHAQSQVAPGTMPTITPISTQPFAVNSGGGIQTKMTYEARLAANDGALADTSYITRSIPIARGTLGGMVRGAVAGGLRLAGWVGLAITAYELYKWYTQDGQLLAPGENVVGATCVAGGSYFTANDGIGCSAPGAAQDYDRRFLANYSYMISSKTVACMPPIGGSCFAIQHSVRNDQVQFNTNVEMHWYSSGAKAGKDPDYVTDPTPVTDTQLGQLAENNPDWWPGMLTDPVTGRPIITPEVANDIDDLKKQLAPRYGVDPQTLPQTVPDPGYLQGQGDPQPAPTSIPEYCAWAAAACNYYKFVEDNWPDQDGKKQETDSPDCITPPACSGDVVMCAVVRNTWSIKCMTSVADPPEFTPKDPALLDQPDQEVGDPGQLDSAGFGWGVGCPFNDLGIDFGGRHVGISVLAVCEYGPWMRAFILILAALKCAQIMAGLRDAAD